MNNKSIRVSSPTKNIILVAIDKDTKIHDLPVSEISGGTIITSPEEEDNKYAVELDDKDKKYFFDDDTENLLTEKGWYEKKLGVNLNTEITDPTSFFNTSKDKITIVANNSGMIITKKDILGNLKYKILKGAGYISQSRTNFSSKAIYYEAPSGFTDSTNKKSQLFDEKAKLYKFYEETTKENKIYLVELMTKGGDISYSSDTALDNAVKNLLETQDDNERKKILDYISMDEKELAVRWAMSVNQRKGKLFFNTNNKEWRLDGHQELLGENLDSVTAFIMLNPNLQDTFIKLAKNDKSIYNASKIENELKSEMKKKGNKK